MMLVYLKAIIIPIMLPLVTIAILAGCQAEAPAIHSTPTTILEDAKSFKIEEPTKSDSIFSKSTGSVLRDHNIVMDVTPETVTYNEEFELSITGLTDGHLLPPGSLTIDGIRIDIPGYFGVPGDRPISDKHGNITFSSKLPVNTKSGAQKLVLSLPNKLSASAVLHFQGASIAFSETEVVPNQQITIIGSLYSPISAPGRTEGMKTHTISGSGPSVVSLNGVPLHAPYINYPILIHRKGTFTAGITLPMELTATTRGEYQIQAVDTGGRIGSAELPVSEPNAKIKDSGRYPGDILTLHGQGFIASRATAGVLNTIVAVYSYVINEGTRSQYYRHIELGKMNTDEHGKFSLESIIPVQASIPSKNLVVLTPTTGESLTIKHNIPSPVLRVSANRAYNSDEITVELRGLHSDYRLPPGSLSLDQHKLDIPGHFNVPGPKPRTDRFGKVDFQTKIPKGLSPGQKKLVFDQPGGGQLSARLQILQARLSFTPMSGVPGQLIKVTTNAFGVSDYKGPVEVKGSKITGAGDSFVYIDGAKLKPPHVQYPIKIPTTGDVKFELRLPIDEELHGKISSEIAIIDTLGRHGSGRLSLIEPKIEIFPAESDKGSRISLTGTGFTASSSLKERHQVDVFYHGIYTGTTYTDDKGSFESSFVVPNDVMSGSVHLVTVKTSDQTLETNHSVPGQYLSVTPSVISSGGSISIVAAGFPAFAKVQAKIGVSWIAPPLELFTDIYGNIEFTAAIPESISAGEQELLVSVYEKSLSADVEIVE